MENSNKNFIDSISPILQQVNELTLKIQHLSNDEKFKDSAIKELSKSLKHYLDILAELTGIELISLEEILKQIP